MKEVIKKQLDNAPKHKDLSCPLVVIIVTISWLHKIYNSLERNQEYFLNDVFQSYYTTLILLWFKVIIKHIRVYFYLLYYLVVF